MQLSTASAKLLIYQAFIEDEVWVSEAPGAAGARSLLSARA